MNREELIELQHLLRKYSYETVNTQGLKNNDSAREKREWCIILANDIVNNIEKKEGR